MTFLVIIQKVKELAGFMKCFKYWAIHCSMKFKTGCSRDMLQAYNPLFGCSNLWCPINIKVVDLFYVCIILLYKLQFRKHLPGGGFSSLPPIATSPVHNK